MPQPQPAILLPVPAAARYLFFVATPGADLRGALKTLATLVDGERCVAGLGRRWSRRWARKFRACTASPRCNPRA